MTRTFPPAVDVVIVGSGPAGAAYARVLSETAPQARIAMFEVGPQLADPPGLHVKNILDVDDRARAQRKSEGPYGHTAVAGDITTASYPNPAHRVVRPGTFLLAEDYQQPGEDGLPAAAMSSNVGGMGAHWTGACPRPGGAELIDFLPDLPEWLDEAERLLHVQRHPFDDAPYSDTVRARLAEVFAGRPLERQVRAMPLAVARRDDGQLVWSGPDVVFGDATRENANFELFTEALVEAVLVEDGSAVGVRVRDRRGGEAYEVRARFVVLACDALRTPQVLWASGVRLPAVGRYLNDQPQIVYAVRLRDVSPEPAATRSPSAAGGINAQSGVTWVPYTDDEPFHGQVMQLDASPIPLVGADVPAPGTIVGLGWFCGKDLQPSDRVEFVDGEVDAYGMPRMRLHYTLTARDRASIAAASAAVERAGRALGEPLDAHPLELSPGASLHYQGTTRMGRDDDGTSVCGPNSEVWGVPGLFVAGNGVIPTPLACNPTLTAVALAVGGARSIADRLHDSPLLQK